MKQQQTGHCNFLFNSPVLICSNLNYPPPTDTGDTGRYCLSVGLVLYFRPYKPKLQESYKNQFLITSFQTPIDHQHPQVVKRFFFLDSGKYKEPLILYTGGFICSQVQWQLKLSPNSLGKISDLLRGYLAKQAVCTKHVRYNTYLVLQFLSTASNAAL